MTSVISYLLIALAVLLAIPVATLAIEVVAAMIFPPRRKSPQPRAQGRPHVAVLIPAHNESTGLKPTIEDVSAQLDSGDRLIVIADNCTDDTARVAAAAGAEVIERHDLTRVGKGYALDFGLKHLNRYPPHVVIVIDADCRVSEGSIHHLATVCGKTGRPAQAVDLMTAPPNSSINFRVAEFAWRVKNWVRPLGLAAFNLPCQLMGTGMAIPWAVIRPGSLASGSLVEDLALGLNLAEAGYAPSFCPSARVTSQFPLSAEGAKSQRYRWEQGHIHLIATNMPHYLYRAIAGGNLSLLALTLDLAVPPLSLLVILLMVMLIITALAALAGLTSIALIITAAACAALVATVLTAWLKFGRDVLPLQSSALIALYVAAKLPMYCRTLSGNIASRWTRTDRKTPQ